MREAKQGLYRASNTPVVHRAARLFGSVLFVVFVLSGSVGVRASGIPVTGSTSFLAGNSYGVSVWGSSINLNSTTSDATGSGPVCQEGSPCDLSWDFYFAPGSWPGYGWASFDGTTVNYLEGCLSFTTTPFVMPTGTTSYQVDATITGDFTGYQDGWLVGSSGMNEVFEFDVAGVGSISGAGWVDGNSLVFNNLNGGFTGTATPLFDPTPEPSSLLLLCTALALVVLRLRKACQGARQTH
ncbi:MAG TPA: PEP-CTERM sorting domain-containing protein [Terriglobia bacterium]|nr:PEP-CTERM sorting domain-containing protein [Terriglobia bacterium]